MINAAIFASGEGTNAENLFRYFAGDPRIKFKIVVTNRPNAGVVARAERYRKTVHIVDRESLLQYTDQLIEYLRIEKIGLVILAGFLLKLPTAFIDAFPGKIINIHPALLPKFGGKGMYGLNVHKAVIESGEKETGITIHYVDEEYDHGDIIIQEKCPVKIDDTPETLQQRVRELEMKYFPKAVELFI